MVGGGWWVVGDGWAVGRGQWAVGRVGYIRASRVPHSPLRGKSIPVSLIRFKASLISPQSISPLPSASSLEIGEGGESGEDGGGSQGGLGRGGGEGSEGGERGRSMGRWLVGLVV